jgi:hypothetical protein
MSTARVEPIKPHMGGIVHVAKEHLLERGILCCHEERRRRDAGFRSGCYVSGPGQGRSRNSPFDPASRLKRAVVARATSAVGRGRPCL